MLFSTDGKIVKCHRCVVAASSPVLSDLFSYSSNIESLPENLRLAVHDSALEVLLAFCYTGSLHDIPVDNLCLILKASIALQMGSAVALILDLIRSHFQIGTIMTTLGQAVDMSCGELVASCLNFVDEKFRNVALEQSFVDAPGHIISLILERDTLFLHAEIEVFRGWFIFFRVSKGGV